MAQKSLFPKLLWLFFASNMALSCGKMAVDGQDYGKTSLSEAQAKMIFRESHDLPNHTQLAIALIEAGKTTFYGVRRENDTIFSWKNHDKVFEIGSISKVFTSTLLADIALAQKVDLDDPIQGYVDVPLKDGVGITFKQLANHTSGLPRLPSNLKPFSVDIKNPYKDYDVEKLERYLSTELNLQHDPGEKFLYSNLGVGLLGYVLTEIENATYEELLQSRIFSSYDMTRSTTQKDKVKNELIRGLNSQGKETPNWELNVLVGGGGILSSVEDLSKFATAQFDTSNKALGLTRRSTYIGSQNGHPITVGLGWNIKDVSGQAWLGHNGATGGYVSAMQVDVNNKNAVIILSNVSGFSMKRMNIESLCNRLMRTLKSA